MNHLKKTCEFFCRKYQVFQVSCSSSLALKLGDNPIPILESIQKIDIVRKMNFILVVSDALNSKE